MSPPLHPCIPTKVPKPPSGERWVHEVKWDGYRLMARRIGEQVILKTRGGYDWSRRYPRVVRSLLALRVHSAALDGEVVWLTQDGLDDFDALHSRKNDEWAMLLAFDLIELDGQDLRDRPLLERKHRLRSLLARADHGLQYVEHLHGDGSMIFEEVCRMGLEGIVSKRADSIYRGGQSRAWRKVKNREHPAYLRVVEALR